MYPKQMRESHVRCLFTAGLVTCFPDVLGGRYNEQDTE